MMSNGSKTHKNSIKVLTIYNQYYNRHNYDMKLKHYFTKDLKTQVETA